MGKRHSTLTETVKGKTCMERERMVVQKRNGKNGRYKGLEAYRRERSTRLNHKPLLMEGWKKKATELKLGGVHSQ